jgi:DNA-binding transcriptional MerR regulator
LSVADVAARLEVSDGQLRNWLATFRWERRFDGSGHLQLDERDLEFLLVIKSLRELDRSCVSIARLISAEPERPLAAAAIAAEAASAAERDQRETLKAALKELQPAPTRRGIWRFWGR